MTRWYTGYTGYTGYTNIFSRVCSVWILMVICTAPMPGQPKRDTFSSARAAWTVQLQLVGPWRSPKVAVECLQWERVNSIKIGSYLRTSRTVIAVSSPSYEKIQESGSCDPCYDPPSTCFCIAILKVLSWTSFGLVKAGAWILEYIKCAKETGSRKCHETSGSAPLYIFYVRSENTWGISFDHYYTILHPFQH